MKRSLKFVAFLTAVACVPSLCLTQADELSPFGRLVDPDGDCKATVRANSINLVVPATHHDLTYTERYSKLNAPRVVQAVEDDFTIETVVESFPSPGATPSSGGDHSFVSGGLLIWSTNSEFIRFETAAVADHTFVWLERFRGGTSAGRQLVTISGGPTRLAVARKDGNVTFTFQVGEAAPKAVMLPPFDLPSKLEAGVIAINSTTRDHSVKFSKFHIKS